MLDPLKCGALSRLPDIQHGFFTRDGGVSTEVFSSLNGSLSQDKREAVMENRRLVGLHLGSKDRALFIPSLCHSARAVFIDEESLHAAAPSADGVVTKTRKLAVAVLGADCAPVLFADAEAGVVGAAHAGWRGAREGVLENIVQLMIDHGARPTRMVAAVGPCIRQRAYEVGPELKDKFVADNAGNEEFFKVFEQGGRPHFNLAGFVMSRLKRMGIGECEDLGVCTRDDERFYSYRRSRSREENGFGCQMSAIMIL